MPKISIYDKRQDLCFYVSDYGKLVFEHKGKVLELNAFAFDHVLFKRPAFLKDGKIAFYEGNSIFPKVSIKVKNKDLTQFLVIYNSLEQLGIDVHMD